MARKQSAYPRRPSHHQPRHTPYIRSLPIRHGPLYPSTPIEPQPEQWDEAQEVRHELRQAFARHPQAPCSEDPLTPASTLSADSISRNISPCLTNASLVVEYPRHLSPFGAPTPGSEDSSGFVYINQPIQPREPYEYQPPYQPYSAWNEHQQLPGVFTPPDSSSCSVVGIIPSPETDSFPRQRVEFISPSGPSPTQLQRYPRAAGPWTGLPLRQDDPMLIDTPSPGSNGSALSPTASNPERGSRRLGPLSTEGRINANQVRDVGACLRCSCMKERCDNNFPCGNCRDKKGRKWKLGCVRDQLVTRARFLFPQPIADRYNIDSTNRYVDNSGFFYLNREPFTLNLTLGLGGLPIEVTVKEIEPVEHQRLLHSYKADTEEGRNEPAKFWDPPIVLYLSDMNAFVEQTRDRLKQSMQVIFEETHENGFWWPWRCFDFGDMDWLGEVVETIHAFHQGCGNLRFYASIRKAHSLLFFNYILDHPFLIKGQEIEKLFENLSKPPMIRDFEWIASETISRFIKAIIFPILKKYTEEVLTELHQLLLSISKSKDVSSARNDLAFCLSFTMLVMLGQNQARLVFLADMTARQEKGVHLDHSDAEKHIHEMEDQLADFIIHFHEFVMKKRRKPGAPAGDRSKPQEEYAAQFKLMDRVAEITQKYHHWKPDSFDIGGVDAREFERNNIHRLCWKFVDAIMIWNE